VRVEHALIELQLGVERRDRGLESDVVVRELEIDTVRPRPTLQPRRAVRQAEVDAGRGLRLERAITTGGHADLLVSLDVATIAGYAEIDAALADLCGYARLVEVAAGVGEDRVEPRLATKQFPDTGRAESAAHASAQHQVVDRLPARTHLG